MHPNRPKTSGRSAGYTLIEMLVVMGIILMMVTMVLLSVNSMLRSSKMSRAVSLILAAADEARTAAITLRRSTRVDLTRLDKDGSLNRLTMVGPFFNENFEGYSLPVVSDTSFKWRNSPTVPIEVQSETSRCMLMTAPGGGAPAIYYNPGARVDSIVQSDYEVIIQARVKLIPPDPGQRLDARSVSLLGCIKETSGSPQAAYQLTITITPDTSGRNKESSVTLQKFAGAGSSPFGSASYNTLAVDLNGAPSMTTSLVEGIWYRMLLSVKQLPKDGGGPDDRITRVAGKVWADGQLEPSTWTVGPVDDDPPLDNGFGGLSVVNTSALVDDVFFDLRPIRVLPPGLRVDALKVKAGGNPNLTTDWELAGTYDPENFPMMFRPDGTASLTYVIRFTDMTSNDRRYVRVDQNTGRARLLHGLEEAVKK